MTSLVQEIVQDVTQIAGLQKLMYELDWVEIFVSNINDPDAVHMLEEAAVRGKCEFRHAQHPMKWGEDFGHFTAKFKGAFFCIGAGESHAALHNPDYDFPDEILGVALKVFTGVLQSPALDMY
jgi:metal-dependent amidase/aminoacylase/carboxypeptidase family protein